MNKWLASITLTSVLLLPAAAQAAPLPKPSAFAMCGVCHTVTKDGPSALGPNLFGIEGRPAGSLPKFAYSPAMKASGIKWNKEQLLAFVSNPKAKVPGNRMAYTGLKNPKDAEAVVNYLLSLK